MPRRSKKPVEPSVLNPGASAPTAAASAHAAPPAVVSANPQAAPTAAPQNPTVPDLN